ncbi:MAG: primosomal protein N' [Treponema sp.]|nr:primosomal protein N' [Treponema sp.]
MQYLEVALNVPIGQTFTYAYDDAAKNAPSTAAVGKRVEVPFGSRKLTGFITVINDAPPATVPKEKIRSVRRIIDDEPLLTSELLSLAAWMADYYVCTLGETISAMMPSGKREVSAGGFSFDDELPFEKSRELSCEQQNAVQEILAARTNNTAPATSAARMTSAPDARGNAIAAHARGTPKTNAGHATFHYLYGPTGSGKTEVFLQAAEKIIDDGKGVIYLVPEIALTSQVLKAVQARFGNTVAAIHSALTPSQKLSEWKRILRKEARIVIGARSAVFAPVPDLGLIIIDEEHDGSYKSGTAPRYHARQVAMHRAQTHAIPLVMGSATPSVESWHLMNTGKLIKHTLSKRLAGGAPPEVTCIDLSKRTGDSCISEELAKEMRATLAVKKQVILFLNRRGFTHFFRCASCGYEMMCKNCSVPMTYHKSEHRLRCHYCGWSCEMPESCPQCGSLDIGYSGFGTEYIEAETKAKFPNAKIVRIDTDALSKKGELAEKLDAFRHGDYDIMLGTQMVAKGLNFPHLQLVGVVLADTALHMPDFRAAERTFSLITQVAGRAGRFFPDGKVLVQTYSPSRAPIAAACRGDIQGFYTSELLQRELLGFPPFSRIVRLVFRSASQKAAESSAEEAAKLLAAAAKKRKSGAEILGSAECPIVKIAQNYRYQILLRGKSIAPLQKLAHMLLFEYSHPQNVYIECDVDPVALL